MLKMVILFDLFNIPDDIFGVIFATNQQKIVAKLLINHIKENGGQRCLCLPQDFMKET